MTTVKGTGVGYGTDGVRRKLPSHFYDKAEVGFVLDLDNRGFTPAQITEALWYELPDAYDMTHVAQSKSKITKRVGAILSERDQWHPDEDHAMVLRALEGSKEAYDALNYYELRTLSETLAAKNMARGDLQQWAELVDESSYALSTRFSKARERDRRRGGHGPKQIQVKTTPEQREAIRQAYYGREKPNVTAIGREFGVSRDTVYRCLGKKH